MNRLSFPKFGGSPTPPCSDEEEEVSLSILPVLVQQVFYGDSEEVPIFLHPTIPRLVPKPSPPLLEEESVIPREKTWQVSARLGLPPPSDLSQDLLLPPTLPAMAVVEEEKEETSRQYYETERFVNSQSSSGSGNDGEYQAIQPTLLQWDEEAATPTTREEEERGRHLRKRPTYLVRAPTASTNEAEITFYDQQRLRQARALPPPAKDGDLLPMSSLLHQLAAQPKRTPPSSNRGPHSKRIKTMSPEDVEDVEDVSDLPPPSRIPTSSSTTTRQASMLTFIARKPRM
ncbi:hypothetical protein BASA81_004874 [Batrachochytrium salamandrivorans]|nr:hypothetical protein BASA81_004874 [Batrachochytrium salamandrivorans]